MREKVKSKYNYTLDWVCLEYIQLVLSDNDEEINKIKNNIFLLWQ